MQTPVIYLFDPLCGWCYGAAPVLDKLSALGMTVEHLPTGLFSGAGARPMDRGFAGYAWRNDQRINQLTGQPFSQTYFDHVLNAENTRFDSGAATLGIVAVMATDPGAEGLALKALQTARYVEGADIVTHHGVAAVLDKAGFAKAAAHLQQADDALSKTLAELVKRGGGTLRSLHADGVPALAVQKAGKLHLISSNALFGSFDSLVTQITHP
ncbi:DsbA family protein [Rhizobium sp. BR 249]|uniref:DsbA family protein n=1 Tax=Rhizobium sp. BR 249 TaxID=3040011 RepID=UPI0039BF4CEE